MGAKGGWLAVGGGEGTEGDVRGRWRWGRDGKTWGRRGGAAGEKKGRRGKRDGEGEAWGGRPRRGQSAVAEDGAERTEPPRQPRERREARAARRERADGREPATERPGGGCLVAAAPRQKIKRKRKTIILIKSR